MARLLIFDEAVRGVDLPLHPVVVGRSRKTDIPIRDSMLSRKHCGIVPLGSGYRLLDLRSANGTYVNGVRVEKFDLSYDDVIEIGNTVIVFLDTDHVPSGKRLAQLRNPQKARELIERVAGRSRKAGAAPPGSGTLSSATKPLVDGAERALLEALGGTKPSVELQRLLEECVLRVIADRLVATSQPLRTFIREASEKVLEDRTPLPSDLQGLRERVRQAVNDVLGAKQCTGSGSNGRKGILSSAEQVAATGSRGDSSAASKADRTPSKESAGTSPPRRGSTPEGGAE